MRTLTTETMYVDNDHEIHEAIAELTIKDDGSFHVSRYAYKTGPGDKWININNKNWSNRKIEIEFNIMFCRRCSKQMETIRKCSTDLETLIQIREKKFTCQCGFETSKITQTEVKENSWRSCLDGLNRIRN